MRNNLNVSEGFACEIMNAYRLTNTTYTEVAARLPLVTLPVRFGSSSNELSLFDDNEVSSRLGGKNEAVIDAQAGKIAELLRATDISYLSLQEEAKNGDRQFSAEHGSLMAAVLLHDSDAFSYTLLGPHKRGAWRIPTPIVERRQSQNSPSPARGTKVKRKEAPESKIERHQCKKQATGLLNPGVSNQESLVNEFCELLDEIFARTEAFGEDEGVDAGTALPLAEIRSIGEVVVKLRSKNIIHNVPVEYHLRLLSLLDQHVQRANGREVDEDDDGESMNFESVMSGLEAVQISLTIMTGSSMAKQIYKEEIIDRMIDFARFQIVHSVFTAYDSGYRQIHKGSAGGGDEGDDAEDLQALENGSNSARRSRKKSKTPAKTPAKTRKIAPSKQSGAVSSVLHKLCSILALLKELLPISKISDSCVLQLMKTMLDTFGVDNIQLLQLKAIGVVCTISEVYPQHRKLIIEEFVTLLWKLPLSKRSLRSYHLADEEPKQIQILTALLLQLVQCSVTLTGVGAVSKSEVERNDKNGDTTLQKVFEPAMEVTSHFWQNVLQRWAAPKTPDGADVKGIVDNLLVDLLTTLNVPEFPAASLLLQVFCVLLFGNAGIRAKDAVLRGMSVDLLGQVAARLKEDAVVCSKDKLWILQELQNKDIDANSDDEDLLAQNCSVCGEGKCSKLMLSCNGCNRWFHGDCIGITKHDKVDRGWLCHCCLCRNQIEFLYPDNKDQTNGSKSFSESKSTEKVGMMKKGILVVQQILLNYLQDLAVSDGTAAYARRFYLCQWLRDEVQTAYTVQFFQNRWNSISPLQDFGVAPSPLSRDASLRISRALGQQRPLARGLDKILERLLVSLTDNSPTPRAKALRAVSAIVEVDPSVLGDERVQRAVEGRFLDSAISVREAAMELVGRHIVSRPDFSLKYFEKIAERIMDTGVSVRKRVIKIIRDVCLSNAGFSKTTEGCLRIISRINDEETSIQDLVGKTFFELWFEEPTGHNIQYLGDESVIPLEITERAEQLVDVLRNLSSHQAMVTIIKRSLSLDFCPQNAKNSATSMVTQAAVRLRCELMCKFLLESVLKVEETTTNDSDIRALPYVLAIHAFCTVDPTLCAPPSDPSRFAVTLQPYLKTQVLSRDAAQLLQSIIFVIDTVLPLLRRPPQSFVEELERDLRHLIASCTFLTVVHACIKSLCSLSKIASKGVASFEFLVRQFFKLLDGCQKRESVAAEKANILRCLFCLGLFARYGAESIETFDDEDINMNQFLELYKFFLGQDDFDIKARALQALGFIFIARPEFMMVKNMDKILETTLNAAADSRIKMQMLRNFSDYLIDVEEKMGEIDENGKIHGDNAVPVAAGAGDSNICGGVIQLHWDLILERCLDLNEEVRQTALKVVEIVLRQGLVHPMSCVPQLIALEVDQLEVNWKLAHRLLLHMNEKYPSFFESRLGDGLLLSFAFIQSGAAGCVQRASPMKATATKPNDPGSPASFAKPGISRIYKLIRSSRNSRNKFLSSVIRKFDFGASGIQSIPFLIYCSEVLSALPFGIPDEPLYVVHTINRVVQVRGGELEANMKTIITEGALGATTKQVLESIAAERERMEEAALNPDFTPPEFKKEVYIDMVDTEGIPEDALDKLRGYCSSAMTLALLLRLKRHMKILYCLNDARCEAYQPTEVIKPGDMLAKREGVKEFNLKDLPVESSTTVRQMLEQYKAFKRLLKEDSVDYAAYTANISTKKRPGRIQVDADAAHVNGHPVARAMPRRKSVATAAVGYDVSGDDDSDEDWGASRSGRRKSAPPVRTSRGKR